MPEQPAPSQKWNRLSRPPIRRVVCSFSRMHPARRPFIRQLKNGYKTLPNVLCECGSNVNRAAIICVAQKCDGNATSSWVSATPLHVERINAGRGGPNYLILIEHLLTVYNSDRHAVVECGACSSDVICAAHMPTSPRVASWMLMMTFALIVKTHAHYFYERQRSDQSGR